MPSDSRWDELNSENERIADSAELSGLHRAGAATTSARPAPRSGTAHPAGGRGARVPAAHGSGSGEPLARASALHGEAETGSWTVRSLAARTRRWRIRPR